MNLIFVDIQQDVVAAWQEHFQEYPQVSIRSGSMLVIGRAGSRMVLPGLSSPPDLSGRRAFER